jgi:Fungal Zn(2)-Cys(6) binuclear cluster domain
MNYPTLLRYHYLSILLPPQFLCLPHLFLLFDRLPSNKPLKGSVRRRFPEKMHVNRPAPVQKLLLVIFAEVRTACEYCSIHILIRDLPARKTKCDGAHPACASCARRSLPCSYIHESGLSSGPSPKKGRRASSSKPPADPSHSLSPPSSRMVPTPSTGNDGYEHGDVHMQGEVDLKRSLEYQDVSRPPKRMRMENTPAIAGIP